MSDRGIRDLVQGDSGAWNSPESKIYRGAHLGVNLDCPSTEPVPRGVELLLEDEECYGGVCEGRQQGSVIDECKRDGEMMCKGQCDVENRRKDTSLGQSCVCRKIRREI